MSAGSYQTERGQDLVMVLPEKTLALSRAAQTLVIRDQIKQMPSFSNGFTLEAGNRQKIMVAGGRISDRHIPRKPQLRACFVDPTTKCHQIDSFNLFRSFKYGSSQFLA